VTDHPQCAGVSIAQVVTSWVLQEGAIAIPRSS